MLSCNVANNMALTINNLWRAQHVVTAVLGNCIQHHDKKQTHTHTHTHTRLTALCPGLPGWAGTRKVKPIWILLKQKTVSGSGISWAICKSAPCSRQITMPAPHRSVFHRLDAIPATQPTVSKHWRLQWLTKQTKHLNFIAVTPQLTTKEFLTNHICTLRTFSHRK